VSRRWFAAAALLALVATPAAGGPYDPNFEFRTIRTPHFQIHFHSGEEVAAARMAGIAERVFDRLTPLLEHVPKGRTHVVLVHQSDQPNGFATVVPWNAVEIDVVPPVGSDQLGNTDDWLTYVFTHEFSHVLHLDRSRGWARVARAVFGRTEIAFPNLSLPEWEIEGFATFVESQGGQGRLHAGDFREVVDAGARAGRLEPLDRLNGGLVDWPSSTGWYAYGARFHEYLAQAYGTDRIVALAKRTSGRFPYLTSGAFDDIYGKTLEMLWREFNAQEMVAARAATAASDTPGTQLTHLGFTVSTPRVDTDGAVWFSASNPHGFPAIYRLRAGRLERVVDRYGGSGLTVGRDVVVFDQTEIVRGAGLAGDLYAFDRRRASVRRLTREARLVDPDLSPDGTRLAVIRTRPAGRELLILDATKLLGAATSIRTDGLSIVARLGEDGDVFARPRWSPDGTRLAVERRRLHGPSEIVVLHSDLSEVMPPISSRGRNTTPDWTADGSRILFASDRDGGPFALFSASAAGDASLMKVLAPAGGALSPARTADGLVFVGYTVAGSDLFATIDNPQPTTRNPQPQDNPQPATDNPAQRAVDNPQPATPYSPWPTFAPRGWLPLVEQRDDRWRLGGSVTANDVLGRHIAALSATWAVTGGPDASALVPGGRPDWSASYAYARWQLAPFASASDRTSLFDALDQNGTVVPLAEREQDVAGGLYRTFQRVKWAQSLLGEARFDRITSDIPGARARVDRTALAAAWTIDTTRRYGYSVSAEHGIRAGVTAETFKETAGDDRTADDLSGDARAYLPLGFSHAVLALRAAGATSRGAPGVRRIFRLGGNDGDQSPGTFSDDAISLLRGFSNGEFAGMHVALANVEARIPLGWPQRGWGEWPIFLRNAHATAFADVGNAWRDTASWTDAKIGAGAELSTDVVVFFGVPLTWTAGVAWGHDGAGVVPDQRSVYFRMGPSF
jgi:hypothetical protein